MKTQRIVFLDLIRMAAILLVITQHAWSGLRLDEPVHSMRGVACDSMSLSPAMSATFIKNWW